MSRFAKKKDLTHKYITSQIKQLQEKGHKISFKDTHMVSNGFPDFALGLLGFTFLVEVKNTEKDKLTKHEEDFVESWEGNYITSTNLEDILYQCCDFFSNLGLSDYIPKILRITNDLYIQEEQ